MIWFGIVEVVGFEPTQPELSQLWRTSIKEYNIITRQEAGFKPKPFVNWRTNLPTFFLPL